MTSKPPQPPSYAADPSARSSGTEGVRQTLAEGQEAASDVGEKYVRQAKSAAQDIKESAVDQAEDAKDDAAQEADRTSMALRNAAHEIGVETPQGRLLSEVANGLAEVADATREKSISDMAVGIADFGRRNPVAFIGGAALVGFAIARFARASQLSPANDSKLSHPHQVGVQPHEGEADSSAQSVISRGSGDALAPAPRHDATSLSPGKPVAATDSNLTPST